MKIHRISLSFLVVALLGMASCSLVETKKINFIQGENLNELKFFFKKKDWDSYDFSKLVVQCEIYKITNGEKVEFKKGIDSKWEFMDKGSLLTLKSKDEFKAATTVEISVQTDDGSVIKKSSYLTSERGQ